MSPIPNTRAVPLPSHLADEALCSILCTCQACFPLWLTCQAASKLHFDDSDAGSSETQLRLWLHPARFRAEPPQSRDACATCCHDSYSLYGHQDYHPWDKHSWGFIPIYCSSGACLLRDALLVGNVKGFRVWGRHGKTAGRTCPKPQTPDVLGPKFRASFGRSKLFKLQARFWPTQRTSHSLATQPFNSHGNDNNKDIFRMAVVM